MIEAAIAAGRADGVLLGVLLAAALFQIAAWTVTRDPTIPWYVAFVATLALIALLRDGLFPSSTMIPPLAMLSLLNGLTSQTGLMFVVVYLRLWQDARRSFWFIVGAETTKLLIVIAFALLPRLQPYVESVRIPVLLVGSLIALPVALVRVSKFPPALSLLSALAFVLLGVVYRAVSTLVGFHQPFIDRWLFEIATASDALLFGIAVVVRARYVVHERRALEAKLDAATAAAEHDPLTGALNHRGLFARAATLASGAVFFIDLDGCEVLAVVEELRRLAPPRALLARIEGDQFVVVARDRVVAPELLAERFSTLAERAAVGFVLLDGMPFENALRIARANAYRTKLHGRSA